jgi:hypothetical protein
MASGASTRGGERNVQDWISLICGVLLFLSPWGLGFSGDLTAARTAWVGGVVVFIVALGAMVQFAEWEEWIELSSACSSSLRLGSWDSRRSTLRCGPAWCSA